MRALMSALLLLLAAGNPGDSRAEDTSIRAAEVVAYGIFTAATSTRAKGFTNRALAADSVTGVRFIEFTHRVPAEPDLGFGFEYVINSRPRGRSLPVRHVIYFPEPGLARPNGRIYRKSSENTYAKLGEPTFYGYGFDETWEMVPGEWTFEVWHKDARLVRRTFTVYLPENEPATP